MNFQFKLVAVCLLASSYIFTNEVHSVERATREPSPHVQDVAKIIQVEEKGKKKNILHC